LPAAVEGRIRTSYCTLLLVNPLLVACGGSGDICPNEQTCDGGVCPYPDEYAKNCDGDAGYGCPSPYQCTQVEDHHFFDAGIRDVCLIPCQSACDCPNPCICKGVDGTHADWGPDFYCICV
jgi:hypothetical protein